MSRSDAGCGDVAELTPRCQSGERSGRMAFDFETRLLLLLFSLLAVGGLGDGRVRRGGSARGLGRRGFVLGGAGSWCWEI